MSAPKLSICIATFKRARFIGETLRSILPQVGNDVEVLVLDGGSPDDTQDVVSEFLKSHTALHYVRLDSNSGVDQDFDHAVRLARGEYCWLMTDDDLLKDGAVSVVLESLRSGPSLLIVNSEVWNHDFTRRLQGGLLSLDADRSYRSQTVDSMLLEAGTYLSFIGSVVILRQLWLDRDRESYFGSLFVHMGVIFQAPLPGATLVLAHPWIRIRYGNAMWKPREFEVWMVKWPELIHSFNGFSATAKNRLAPIGNLRHLMRLFLLRGKGAYTLDDYRKWLRPRQSAMWFRTAAAALAVVPGVVVNSIALLLMKWRGSHLDVLDLRASRFHWRKIT